MASEDRCSPYNRDHYTFPQDLKIQLYSEFAESESTYDKTVIKGLGDFDIDHIIALSEAHDSGLCAASMAVRTRFARDLDNLTLATRELNIKKGAKDAAEWVPAENRCWFSEQVIEVRKEYALTIDQAEAEALDNVLADCEHDAGRG